MATKTRLAIVGLAAGLLGGGAAGLALTVPGTAHGQDSTTSTTTAKDNAKGRTSYLDDTLAPLVKDGTITQAQADAVIKALEDARPNGKRFFGGDGTGEDRLGGKSPFGDLFGAVAKKLGVNVDDLRSALRDGKSIADIAKEKKIGVKDVVDAAVAAATADLDQAVKDGKLSQAEADKQVASLRDRINGLVNGNFTRFGERHGGFGPRGEYDNQNSSQDNSA